MESFYGDDLVRSIDNNFDCIIIMLNLEFYIDCIITMLYL